jgi:dolichyl-phosphate-mannose--protein O-mannosyl transferase
VDGKSGDLWTTKKLVTLIHEDTNKYLHSHNHKFGHPIYNQHEVTCYHQQNSDNYWIATEGIYYPVE